jgi:hypothetical protein
MRGLSFLSWLTGLALLLASFAMVAPAGARTSHHDQASAGAHCPGKPAAPDHALPKNDCLLACAALPALGEAVAVPVVPPAPPPAALTAASLAEHLTRLALPPPRQA